MKRISCILFEVSSVLLKEGKAYSVNFPTMKDVKQTIVRYDSFEQALAVFEYREKFAPEGIDRDVYSHRLDAIVSRKNESGDEIFKSRFRLKEAKTNWGELFV